MELLSQKFCCDEPQIRFIQSEISGMQTVDLVCNCGHIWRPTDTVIDTSKIIKPNFAI